MKRTHVLTGLLTVLLAGSLTACGNDDKPAAVSTPSATPSATATSDGAPCTPSGKGTTDLATKPVYTVPNAPAPTETTTVDIVCGTGAEAKDGSAVQVKYVGVDYKTGQEFDASWKGGADNTFPFTVGSGVIPGFSKGVTGMKEGGRRLVVIPPADGYGDSGPVPGGTLAFIIDLVKVG